VLKSGDVGRRRWRRSANEILKHPVSTNHGRGAGRVGGDHQNASLTKQSATMALFVNANPAKPSAVHVGNPIVFCETLIEIGMVRLDQIENAAILAKHARKEQLCLLPERLPQIVVKIRV